MKTLYKVNVFDVAKYILKKTKSVTTFKLQKLCYYSQVWSLVWDEEPLFPEKFYAWSNGPVCKELYEQHKGVFNIEYKDLNLGDVKKLNLEQKKTIDAVIKGYGNLTGQELSNLTHTEAPWVETRDNLKIGQRGNKPISLNLIADYYSGIYAEQRKKNKSL